MATNTFLKRITSLNKKYQKENDKKAPKEAGSILYSAASKLVNNRVLDLYLKALGITVLTPTTLVPLALVMGATTFKDTVEDILALEKRASGDKRKSKKSVKKPSGKDGMYIPIIDDAVFGTYTKYTGAAVQLSLSPFTLIPVGVAIAMYEFFGYLAYGDGENKDGVQVGGGSGWKASQMSGGPINSPNLWADYLSTRDGYFGPQMTPKDMEGITGYPFQQAPNTLLKIEAAPEPLDGLGAGVFGGKRKQKRRTSRRRSATKKRVKDMYRRSRSRRRR